MAMNAVAAVALPLYCAPVMMENSDAFTLNIVCWQVHAMFSMAVAMVALTVGSSASIMSAVRARQSDDDQEQQDVDVDNGQDKVTHCVC
jgi:hypothetical protein